MFVETTAEAIAGGPSAAGQIGLTGIPHARRLSGDAAGRGFAATPNFGARTFDHCRECRVLTTSLPDASVGHPYSQALVAFDPTDRSRGQSH
jgi:hypothetical protein